MSASITIDEIRSALEEAQHQTAAAGVNGNARTIREWADILKVSRERLSRQLRPWLTDGTVRRVKVLRESITGHPYTCVCFEFVTPKGKKR